MKLILLITLIFSLNSFAVPKRIQKTKYRTFFGSCPAKTVGNLALKLMKTYEQTQSLKSIKEQIIAERLDEKHFLSSYKVNFNPITNLIKFNFDCPRPLMKVQIYKKNGLEYYTAILVENGKLFDPTYEHLLQTEKKLKHRLPLLALPVGEMEKEVQNKITGLVKKIPADFMNTISEIIINERKELTFIITKKRKPVSVFLGSEMWDTKMVKLNKILSYLGKKKKIPSIINLTNNKKVVVKFPSRI